MEASFIYVAGGAKLPPQPRNGFTSYTRTSRREVALGILVAIVGNWVQGVEAAAMGTKCNGQGV